MDMLGITPHEILIIVFVSGGAFLSLKYLKSSMPKALDAIIEMKIEIVKIHSILSGVPKVCDKLERENERNSERLQRLEMDVAYIKHIFENNQKL